MKFWIYSNFKFLIILDSFETEIVLIISPVLFTPHKIMSTSFFPQYISFKMIGLTVLLDNLTLSLETKYKVGKVLWDTL